MDEIPLCACLRYPVAWRLHYGTLVYHVCEECMQGRLDDADVLPCYEPDNLERYQP